MTDAVTLYPGAATATIAAQQSIVALYGPMLGGRLRNPSTTAEQGIAPLITTPALETIYIGPLDTYGCDAYVPLDTVQPTQIMIQQSEYGPPEALYVKLTGPISLAVDMTSNNQFNVAAGDFNTEFSPSITIVSSDADAVLAPGDTFVVPANFGGSVWVASLSAGHRFSAIIVQPATQYPPTPYAGAFPPSGPTTKLTTIPSYLYKQYEDDDDLQALVAAQNQVTQDYVDTFNDLNLPDVTTKSGALLDWVGAGLYGLPRPTFFSGRYESTGPLDTVAFNDPPELNQILSTLNFEDVAVTSDDVYKRVLLWHLWKADGRQVSTPWIRRRVVRFLFGEGNQGGANHVSVVSDAGRNLSITIVTGERRIIGGALYNGAPFNEVPFDAVATSLTTFATPALAAVLKEGLDSGALELPAQYAATCRIGVVGEPPTSTSILDLENLLFDIYAPVAATYLATEDGFILATETGTLINIGLSVPVSTVLTAENDVPLLSEDGRPLNS